MVCLLVAFLIPAGCIFSPKKKDDGGGGPTEYPQLVSPFNVLDALEQAYAAKDTNEIKLIYDDAYVGDSFDPKTLDVIRLSKADEVAHVKKLAETPTVGRPFLSFPNALVRERDESDPPGWARITVQLMQLEIVDGPDTYNLIANETFEFHFSAFPDSTSPTDTLWKIARWTEY